MKKLMAFMICMAMCVAMFGCVEKKEFDSGESGSSPLASNEGVIENAPSAESSQEEAASAVTEVSKTADAGAQNLFPWRGYTMHVKSIVDDESIVGGNNTPQGRLIQIFVECVYGVMKWDEITTGYTDYYLKDATGNEYSAISSGFRMAEGGSNHISDPGSNEYVAMLPTFDIPEDADISQFTLYVKTETEGETIRIDLRGVALNLPDD